ncbi:MAG TPA: Hsp20/alpha crystallin family protein, partial [Candidatus Methanoperedens sp.]
MFRGYRRPDKGFFDEFERQIEEMNQLMTQMMQSMGSEPLVYGFSLQFGPDGIPHIERFGNV